MRRFFLLTAAVAWLGLAGVAGAQVAPAADQEKPAAEAKQQPSDRGPKYGSAEVQRWRIGLVVTAVGGPCRRLSGAVSVPMDWPEQRVKVVGQDLSPGVKIGYQNYGGMVRQMLIQIPSIAADAEARAVVIFEVDRRTVLPPDDTDVYQIPDPKGLKGPMLDYLKPSPYIESNHARIKALAAEIGVKEPKAWNHVKAIYDWVREKIQYQKDAPLTGVIEALDKGTGDCNQLTSTFVAICRAAGIPARTVRIPGHCFPEFYLVDDRGQGWWFPCEASGSEAFGGILHRTPILQKGDAVRVSVRESGAKSAQSKLFRFPPERLEGTPFRGSGQPQLKVVCQPAKEEVDSEQ